MTTWGRPPVKEERHHHPQRRKTPSFSSSLLDAIYHSIDESQVKVEETGQEQNAALSHRKRNTAAEFEEEIASFRKAIMVEKWMENYASSKQTRSSRSRHVNSDSSSSTDSSLFSSSETDSASKSTPKSSVFHATPKAAAHLTLAPEATTPKHEDSRFMRTKSRALKIYGDLKKVKQPISPGRKIANFLNSIFTPRNLKKHEGMEEWSSMRRSRSIKESSTTTTCSLTSRSCLNRPAAPQSRGNKSKRSVRFCTVSTVIVDEDCQPCGLQNIYGHDDTSLTPMPKINSHFLKKNIDGFRNYEEKKSKKHEIRGFYEESDAEDGNSCTSSDLFELENIGIVGIGHGAHMEELPVYGTTSLKINQAIANGFAM